ncbi:MAG: hypothetical protein HOW71_06415 [Nonomuraea sp.]|nr:hypothetical protein [Nonomuraea sp.]NUP61796.1 hypothetical protein [Nonomuraea sp.]
MDPFLTTALVLAATALVIFRQMATRQVGRPAALVVPAVMIVIGAATGGVIDSRHLTLSLVMLAVEAVAALAFGAVRAATVRVWHDASGVAWSKATGWTLLAWLGSIAIRVGLYAAGAALGLATSTGGILLFLGLSLGTQAYLVARRARTAVAGNVRRTDTFVG